MTYYSDGQIVEPEDFDDEVECAESEKMLGFDDSEKTDEESHSLLLSQDEIEKLAYESSLEAPDVDLEDGIKDCKDVELEGYNIYLRQISQFTLLTKEDEVRLFTKMGQHDYMSQGYRRIRDEIVTRNLRLVIATARDEFRNKTTVSMQFLDLIQEGNAGLIHAVDKFDINRGTKFSTYATYWIRQYMQRGIAASGMTTGGVPIHKYNKMRRTLAIKSRLICELHREPTTRELAKETGYKEQLVCELLKLAVPVASLDKEVGISGKESENTPLNNSIADDSASHIEDDTVRKSEIERIKKIAKKSLNKMALDIFLARNLCTEPESYISLGARLGISGEYARKIDDMAKKLVRYVEKYGYLPPNLRKPMRKEGFEVKKPDHTQKADKTGDPPATSEPDVKTDQEEKDQEG